MLSRKENDKLTRVGPGTPAGKFLRRYWHPVAVASELKNNPIKPVRLLGEELVLYRSDNGSFGLVGEHCSHRGTSLAYGQVEGECIRCPYHGWLFDREGRCREMPAEPNNSNYKIKIRHTAYPTEKLGGLVYGYLGPKPVPLLPRYDVLVRTDGERKIVVLPVLRCNWFQIVENTVDPTHTQYLHGAGKGKPVHGDKEAEIRKYGFEVFEYGIMKKRFASNGDGSLQLVNQHPLIFPYMLRQHHGREHYIQYRVPLDDTHTQFYEMYFMESKDGSDVEQPEDPPVQYADDYRNPDGTYRMDRVWMQDFMAWETEGAIFDRSKEHLATADRGITILRKLLKREIEKVRRGQDPIGVIRDFEKNRLIRFETVTDSRRDVGKGR